MRPIWTLPCLLLLALSSTSCTPARTTIDPPPARCPAIPDELLTCPPGSTPPAPTARGVLEALTIERTAGEICRAKMREVRALETERLRR